MRASAARFVSPAMWAGRAVLRWYAIYTADYLWVIQSNKPTLTCSHPTYSRTRLSARWRHSHSGTPVSLTRFRNAERRMSASKAETATWLRISLPGHVIAMTLAKALEQFARGLDCASGVVHITAK